MDNLITKTTLLTNEEYQNSITTIKDNLLNELLVLILFLGVLALTYFIAKEYIDLISAILAFSAGILSIMLFLLLIVTLGSLIVYSATNEPGVTMVQKDIPLTEIKNHIKVDNNRLTINALPENYRYKNDKFDKTKSHDFKIDDFYKELNAKLIDSSNNTYEITHEQLEELKRR